MKLIKQEKKWEPITLVIESEAEYYLLLACLNTSLATAHENAQDLGFSITEEMAVVSLPMFEAVESAYHKESDDE